MKFVQPDTCLADYQARRSIFLKGLCARTSNLRERADEFEKWTDTNSPYSSAEKLANLRWALFDDDDAPHLSQQRESD